MPRSKRPSRRPSASRPRGRRTRRVTCTRRTTRSRTAREPSSRARPSLPFACGMARIRPRARRRMYGHTGAAAADARTDTRAEHDQRERAARPFRPARAQRPAAARRDAAVARPAAGERAGTTQGEVRRCRGERRERAAFGAELARRALLTPTAVIVTQADGPSRMRAAAAVAKSVVLAAPSAPYGDLLRALPVTLDAPRVYLSYLTETADVTNLRDQGALVTWPGSRYLASISLPPLPGARAAFMQA